MKTDVNVVSRESCVKKMPLAAFCSEQKPPSSLDTCVGELGSGMICGGKLQGVISRTCNGADEITEYTDVSQLFNWIFISHLHETLKLIDNEMLKNLLFSCLDFIAYYVNTPKIADDFETLKIFF